jgi:hypothetical protein
MKIIYQKYTFFLLILWFLNFNKVFATEQFSSYEGTTFLVSFMQNEFYVVNETIGVELKIFIATRQQTNIKVTYPGGTYENYSIPGDSVLILNISNKYYYTESEVIQNGAIEINTDNPVVVYAFNSQPHSSDSYVCVPVSNWGTEYAILSVPNDQYTPTSAPPTKQDSIIQYTPRSSEFLIIAGYNDTRVTFRPKALTEKGKQVDRYYTITLNKGDTYLVKSYPYTRGFGDLTGTIIKSTQPIGVLSGHVRTALPQNLPPGKDSKDHLVEMLAPISSWGKTYISLPFGVNPYGDLFRVMAIEPGTKLQIFTSEFPTEYNFVDSLDVKSFNDINVPAIWQASKPIQIGQFMQRSGIEPESKEFDPAMVMLPPKEQFVQRVLFTTPGGVFYNPQQYSAHYVAIIAEESSLNSLYLDGIRVDTISKIKINRIINTDLHWDIIQLSRGTHELVALNGKFSGILYGVGEFDSYAMVLGASLLKPDVNDNMAPVIKTKVQCYSINGSAFDFPTNDATGINFGKVNDLETFNFGYTIFPFAPKDTVINFIAGVKDIYAPAKFVIDFWDKQGNKSTYIYEHSPVSINWTNSLDFGTVSWTDSLCLDFIVKNEGKQAIPFDSISFPKDSRLKIFNFNSISDSLYPNESINGTICFTPKGSINQLNDEISFNFGCGIRKRIPIIANLVAPAIVTTGWDFGNVYLQDSAVHKISVKNIGNTNIRIDSLYFVQPDSHFEFETIGIFPYNLMPDSTLEIMAKFKPNRRQYEFTELRFANNLRITNSVLVSGTGVAPIFADYVLDFGKRRIGITTDTTIKITNDGNIQSKLSFKQFLLKDFDDNNTITLQNINNDVPAVGFINLDFSFNPQNTDDYHIVSLLNCDWKPHPEIIFEVKGKGSIPIISTKNINFDTVIVFTTKNLVQKSIFNSGNETLTIDSIFVINGDKSSFNIDYSSLKGLKIPENSSFDLPIDFNPQKLGAHKLILGVVNDAMPAYNRKVDTIEVSGFAISPDDLNVDLSLSGDGDYSTCLKDTIFATFINNDNIEVFLTNLQTKFYPDTVDASFIQDVQSLLPIEIKPHSNLKLPIQILLHFNETVEIQIQGTFNNKLVKSSNLKIEPKTYKIPIGNLADINPLPGDTLQIAFSGVVENSTDLPVKFDISVKLDKDLLYCLNKKSDIIFQTNSGIVKVPAIINQSKNEILVSWASQPILLQKNDKWNLSLNFLTLLSDKKSSDVNITLLANDCYDSSNASFKATLQEVCMNPMRQILIVDDQPTLSVYPNPVNNLLKIDLELKKNSYIYISIFDIFGKELIIENKFLSKGKYYLIYVVENMTNGKYFLRTVINGKNEFNNVINIIR